MLYTDGAHLIAESIDELIRYVTKLGLNPDWIHFMGKNFHPHFDICGQIKKRVLLDKQVQKVSKKDIVKLCKLYYSIPENDQEVKEWEEFHQKPISSIPMPSESDYDRMFENIMSRVNVAS